MRVDGLTDSVSRAHYGYRAVGLLEQGGRLLLQRDRSDRLWALPGGGVELGESAETALRREFIEELGLPIRSARPVALIENEFVWGGERRSQLELYFAVRADATLLGPDGGGWAVPSREPHLEFRFFTPDQCARLDIRPSAARRLLFAGDAEFVYAGRPGTCEPR